MSSSYLRSRLHSNAYRRWPTSTRPRGGMRSLNSGVSRMDGASMESLDLRENERELRGSWVVVNGEVSADDVCSRIEWLLSHRLERIATDPSGWDLLFRDPRDGRLWERTYPQSHLHGGGPPMLKVLPHGIAQSKYGYSRPAGTD